MDIFKADKQGRTSVHYAAIYGSISCLKVFKKYKVDLMVTDENGATPAHHAATGGHLECLKFLTKVGIVLGKRDKSWKTSAHYVSSFEYVNFTCVRTHKLQQTCSRHVAMLFQQLANTMYSHCLFPACY
jgi:Flp pilus assembly pilin Flp